MEDVGEQSKERQVKESLRALIRTKLAAMTSAQRKEDSRKACELLEQQSAWKLAKSILFFAPMSDEVDIWQLLEDSLKSRKTVLLPRYDPEQKSYVACHIVDASKDVEKGQFGIREPGARCAKISLNRLDLILVPGIGFDLSGRRLGRGKGFYDQLLKVTHGPTCGVAFDQQIVEQIPVEPHDMSLSYILTPTRWQVVE